MNKFQFYITNRFILFIAACLLFVGAHYLFTNTLLPDTSTKNLWFYSGLFMLLFSILFIEPYYSSPKNVITNSIPLVLVYLSIKGSFNDEIVWWISIGLILMLLTLSILSLALSNQQFSPEAPVNKFSNRLKNLVVIFGQGKVIYSFVFISILFLYKAEIIEPVGDTYMLVMVGLWGATLLLNPKRIHSSFQYGKIKVNTDAIGEIFGVQSKKIFLVKLFEDRKSIKKFDVVRFKYSMQDSNEYAISGVVFDTYLLNQEKWAKVLQLSTDNVIHQKFERNIVYKVSIREEREALERQLNIENFVGVVIEGSTIGSVKFEYSKKVDDLQEGDLLELKTGGKRLFYQVVGGKTEFEKLENKNESGFIEGEALQLGEWQNEQLSFQKFGWVPHINTPIFKADTSNIDVQAFDYPEYKLGVIPNTQLPSVINLHDAVSHHLALLGVTGSGKSFLAREIIRELGNDTKVICVDFTGEWRKEIEALALNKDNINEFLTGDEHTTGRIELPVMSNTVEVIAATERLFSTIFDSAKAAYDADSPLKICLVLEEAHTIVPESNFLGVNNWDSKAIVNKMGQIALQGRKYGVGLMVIAQRTANVSKTVLTQCNTIVCFQAFDETSFIFLSNYIGGSLVQALPNLNKYHAVVTGKAIRANIPMIVNLERTSE